MVDTFASHAAFNHTTLIYIMYMNRWFTMLLHCTFAITLHNILIYNLIYNMCTFKMTSSANIRIMSRNFFVVSLSLSLARLQIIFLLSLLLFCLLFCRLINIKKKNGSSSSTQPKKYNWVSSPKMANVNTIQNIQFQLKLKQHTKCD